MNKEDPSSLFLSSFQFYLSCQNPFDISISDQLSAYLQLSTNQPSDVSFQEVGFLN